MKALLSTLLIFYFPVSAFAALHITIIQGLDGTPHYHQQFSDQTETLKSVTETIADKNSIRFFFGEDATRDNILSHFQNLKNSITAQDRVAVFMVGHGSFDGYEYKFNIPGPDLTDADIAEFMDALPAEIQLLVNTSSASGVLNNSLKNDSRVLITATRNGNERLATRFGEYFFNAFDNLSADINKNNAITAQEAFDYAEREVTDYFESQGQLATEHAEISGAHASQFVLARIGLSESSGDDPELTRLISERGAIDVKIEELQLNKSNLQSEEFLNQLQSLMIDLSLVQEKIDEVTGGDEL
ncbi:MAG: hypothetical protein ACI9XC_002764 [Gammaproteobacteria bacterium]|jgi:hypothetical protein